MAGKHTADSLQLAQEGLGFAAQVERSDLTLENLFMALAGHGAESEVSACSGGA